MQKLKKSKHIYITGRLLLVLLLLSGCGKSNDLEIFQQETMDENLQPDRKEDRLEVLSEKQNVDSPDAASEVETSSTRLIYVQLTGAVRCPGVYEMPADARVFEAVEKAGGMLPEAETTAVNQAMTLTDGQMIHIYTREEWEKNQASRENSVLTPAAGGVSETDDRININTADVQQLCSVPGIGEAKAKSIITYRQEHGEFNSIEDIKNVNGIKDGLFQKIKDKIKV